MSSIQHLNNEYLLSPSMPSSLGSVSSSNFTPTPLYLDGDEELARTPLPISYEYDIISDNFVDSEDGEVDRSEWLQRALDEQPEIRRFREMVLPIQRASKFAELYLPKSRLISHEVLLSLISQHLRTLGLIQTQTSLHSEWDGQFKIPAHMYKSQLNYLIQRGIFRAERFWELENEPPVNKKVLDEEISKIIGGLATNNDNEQPFENEIIDNPECIVVENNEVKGASLNNLILLMTSKHDYPIPNLIKAFCLTYKSVVSSQVLFNKLKERFEMSFMNNEIEGAKKTFDFLKKWIRKNQDEIEQPIQKEIKAYAEKKLKKYFNEDISNLFVKGNKKHKFTYASTMQVNLGKCYHRLWSGKFKIFEIPPEEIARQFTYISATTYYAVQESEFLNSAWEVARLKHQAPNIIALINRTNSIPKFIASLILTEKSFHKRIQIISYFLQVMRALKELKNYCDYFDIYNAFFEPSISRLTVHLSMLNSKDKELIKSLEPFIDVTSRKPMMRKLMSTLEYKKFPCLPHYPIYLTSIAKINEGYRNKVDGLINISKFTGIYSLIKEFNNFKKVRYSILPIDQIQVKLLEYPILDDKTLLLLSEEVEPDNSSEETLRMMDYTTSKSV